MKEKIKTSFSEKQNPFFQSSSTAHHPKPSSAEKVARFFTLRDGNLRSLSTFE